MAWNGAVRSPWKQAAHHENLLISSSHLRSRPAKGWRLIQLGCFQCFGLHFFCCVPSLATNQQSLCHLFSEHRIKQSGLPPGPRSQVHLVLPPLIGILAAKHSETTNPMHQFEKVTVTNSSFSEILLLARCFFIYCSYQVKPKREIVRAQESLDWSSARMCKAIALSIPGSGSKSFYSPTSSANPDRKLFCFPDCQMQLPQIMLPI